MTVRSGDALFHSVAARLMPYLRSSFHSAGLSQCQCGDLSLLLESPYHSYHFPPCCLLHHQSLCFLELRHRTCYLAR